MEHREENRGKSQARSPRIVHHRHARSPRGEPKTNGDHHGPSGHAVIGRQIRPWANGIFISVTIRKTLSDRQILRCVPSARVEWTIRTPDSHSRGEREHRETESDQRRFPPAVNGHFFIIRTLNRGQPAYFPA